jgi:hypothetical protein
MQKNTAMHTRHREGETQNPMHCPTINKSVTATRWQSFASPNGNVRWWYCPLCQGWHVHVPDETKLTHH